MKQFIKFLFASCLGTIFAFGVMFFGLFLFGSMFSAKDMSIPSNSVLLLDFSKTIPEKSDNVQQDPFDFEASSYPGLHRIMDLIEHAQSDDRVKGIVFKPGFGQALGMSGANEIQDALEAFRDSTDKFVYSYADFYTNTSYLLASASDSIYLNPMGMMEMRGYGAMIPFFKDMLDKVGVEMEIFYAGNYKSATEPFRRNDMSPQNREQVREYLGDNFRMFLDQISTSRGISKENLLELINALDMNNKEEALALGLLDDELYWHEFEDKLRDELGLSRGKKIRYVDIDEYSSKVTITSGSSKNRIAVVFAEGDVVYDSEERAVISEKKYHKIFDRLRRDSKLKAIVLRVNSPGGSAFSSDAIWGELEEFKAQGIPVIASFGDYAASGGYYIAAGADKIVSHPQTLTGSIGVFSMLPNLTELMNDKLGIQFDTVKTSPNAIQLTPYYDLTDDERVVLNEFTDQMYEKFLSRVAAGRDTTIEAIHEVAQGRVWTGAKAYELGLVDTLGGLDLAIEIAADMAELDDYKIASYPKIKKDVWQEIMSEMMKSQDAGIKLNAYEKQLLDEIKDFRAILKYREPMARLPFKVKH
ncbi:MAG: signal peptide peptidase SppA [Saprospiraceae bacterium]|nr:signal peptide peptidase SppA [Saprospiraceae bacterium]